MKKAAIIALFATISVIGSAQTTIRRNAMDMEDITNIFEAMDIHVYSFDLSEIAREPHKLHIYVDDHRDSTVKEIISIPIKRNMRYVNDYRESQRDEVRKMHNLAEDEHIVSKIEKLSVYMLPKNDSTMKIIFEVQNYGTLRRELSLHKLSSPTEATYFYSDRPFKLPEIKQSQKSPLILYGSGWYDAESNIFRMCGEAEIDPDMTSSDILAKLPQYYVIGIRAEKTNE